MKDSVLQDIRNTDAQYRDAYTYTYTGTNGRTEQCTNCAIATTAIGGTCMALLLIGALVWLVVYSKRQFAQGIKWAGAQNPSCHTDQDMQNMFEQGKRNPNTPSDKWVEFLK